MGAFSSGDTSGGETFRPSEEKHKKCGSGKYEPSTRDAPKGVISQGLFAGAGHQKLHRGCIYGAPDVGLVGTFQQRAEQVTFTPPTTLRSSSMGIGCVCHLRSRAESQPPVVT